jgi:lipopolysaccharide export system permease protein
MTALVVLVVAGVEMFVAILAELDDIGTHGYGIKQALVFVLATLPGDVYPLFPAAALMGCLIGLGRLASQSELIVMQASGVSKTQIALFVMYAALLMLVVVTFIGEVVNPKLEHFATRYKVQAQTDGAIAEVRQGLWVRDGENFIHIEQVLPDGKLISVLRYQLNQTQISAASRAKEGSYQNGQWVFSDVFESIFSADKIVSQHFATQVWPITLDPDFVGIANIDPDQASLTELKRYIHYLNKTGLYTKPYEFEFWKRIFRPFSALVMIGLAIPFIFGSLRTKPMGFRILVGVMIGFGFYTFNEFLGPFSLLYQIPPFLCAFVPLLCFAVFDLILLRRAR